MLPTRKQFKWSIDSKEIIDHEFYRDFTYSSKKGKIKIKDLDTNHIKNILNKMKREYDTRKKTINTLLFELIYREIHEIK